MLDAPELQDDFYLNLVDWSAGNLLSVGLGACVYLWSACTSQVSCSARQGLGSDGFRWVPLGSAGIWTPLSSVITSTGDEAVRPVGGWRLRYVSVLE